MATEQHAPCTSHVFVWINDRQRIGFAGVRPSDVDSRLEKIDALMTGNA